MTEEIYKLKIFGFISILPTLILIYVAFSIEKSHLGNSHFRDTGQNVKYVAKIEKNVCAYSARKKGPLADPIGPDA